MLPSKRNAAQLLLLACLTVLVLGTNAQSYEDKRCKCICPSLSSVLNNTKEKDRMMIIENVPPNKCNCEGVILPRIAERINGKEQEFCPRCECKYENRNTSVIKVVVVMVIWVISLLVVYMLFLILLEPLLNKRVKGNYQEHTNEDDEVVTIGTGPTPAAVEAAGSALGPMAGGGPSASASGGNVLNRVGHQQDKWKRQVREQRKNIYDRHTMLN